MSTLYYHIFYFKKIEVLDLAAHFSLERSPIKNRINRSNKGAAHMEAGILPRHSGKTAARSGDCFLAHCNRSDTDPQFCTQNQIEAQRQRVRLQLRWNAMHRGDKPAFWPAALCAVQAFSPAAKTLAEGQFTCPEHRNTEGWSDQRERNPKRKT